MGRRAEEGSWGNPEREKREDRERRRGEKWGGDGKNQHSEEPPRLSLPPTYLPSTLPHSLNPGTFKESPISRAVSTNSPPAATTLSPTFVLT